MSPAGPSNSEREKRSARPATIHRIAHALRVPVAAITRDYEQLEGPAALERLQVTSLSPRPSGRSGQLSQPAYSHEGKRNDRNQPTTPDHPLPPPPPPPRTHPRSPPTP